MTTEVTTAVQELLGELREVYDGIRERVARRDELNQVRQAVDEYNALVAGAETMRNGLLGRKEWLEGEIRRMRFSREEEQATPDLPPIFIPVPPPTKLQATGPRETAAGDRGHVPDRAVRGRLKKLMNRWAYSWQIGPDLQGRINGIADAADSPLGEALALLDWKVFEDANQTNESAEEQLARLQEWRGPLAEYHRQIRGDVETLEVRFGSAVKIWMLWRGRDGDDEGRRRWDDFVAATRAAFEVETQRLKLRTASLDAELDALKRTPSRGGGARG